MKLVRPILLRIFYGLVSLAVVSFMTFAAASLAPGNAALLLAGDKGTPQAIKLIEKELGLDQPFLVRYGRYVSKAAQGDFGRSYYGTRAPVGDKIRENLPMTLRISLWAILLAALIGITLGTMAALHADSWLDRLILGTSTFGVTVPNFVLAPLLIYFFAIHLDVLPTGWTPERVASDFYYLVLPVSILSLRPMATITRLTRATTLDTIGQDYIALAIAKGVPTGRLIRRHILRNSLLPVLTAIGTSFGFLLTGSFILETAFTLPGIGREGIEAIQRRDTPMILATTLVAGVLFIGVNLIVDLLQPILDPRIRESQV